MSCHGSAEHHYMIIQEHLELHQAIDPEDQAMDPEEGAEVSVASKPGYAPVELRSLHIDFPLTCDLFIQEHGKYVLYREASLPFTAVDRERLIGSGVNVLWVSLPANEYAPPPERLVAILAVADEKLPPLAKAGLWYGSAMSLARQAIAESPSPEALSDISKLLSTTVGYISRSETALPALLAIMRHHYSVYAHSINVAVYALGLGKYVGIKDDRELLDLGLGAFLHDVGKSKVPNDLLDRAGPLSPEEWSIVRQHPTWGKEILSGALDLSEDVLTVVMQHHERLDGSGYPAGLQSDEIHQLSLIVSLVDSFEAMTSNRPYRAGATAYNALAKLRKEITGTLDQWLFANFVQLLGNPSLAYCA